MDEAESIPQRRGQGSGFRCGAHQRETGQVKFDRPRCRALADDQIQLEVFHRRVQRFLYRSRQSVNFVDEENVMLLEIRQDRRKIARVREDQSGRRAQRPPHFTRNDVGNGRLPEPWRAVENRMVERLSPLFRRFDADPQGILHARLPDVLVEGLRAERLLHAAFIVRQLRINDSLGHNGSGLLAHFLTVSRAAERISAAAARRLGPESA
jgi:hypothetical protein